MNGPGGTKAAGIVDAVHPNLVEWAGPINAPGVRTSTIVMVYEHSCETRNISASQSILHATARGKVVASPLHLC